MVEMVDVRFVVPLTAASGDLVPVEIAGGHEGDQAEVLLRLEVPEGATPGATVHVPVRASQLRPPTVLPASHQHAPTSPTSWRTSSEVNAPS